MLIENHVNSGRLSAPGIKRGVLNRIQSSTVCNASATNSGGIPVFPPVSVTQTLIRAYTCNHKRIFIPEVSASGIFLIEILSFLTNI